MEGGRQREGDAWNHSAADGDLRIFRFHLFLSLPAAHETLRKQVCIAAGCNIPVPCILGDKDWPVSPDGSYGYAARHTGKNLNTSSSALCSGDENFSMVPSPTAFTCGLFAQGTGISGPCKLVISAAEASFSIGQIYRCANSSQGRLYNFLATTPCAWPDTGFPPSEATARGTAEISRSTRRSGLSGQATWSPARHRPMESRRRIPAVTQLEETAPQAIGHPLDQLQATEWVRRLSKGVRRLEVSNAAAVGEANTLQHKK